MRRTAKQTTLALLTLAALTTAPAIAPAVAQATPISFLYAECTLRGGYSPAYGSCTLASDNDVKRRWDILEANHNINIVSSRPVEWTRHDPDGQYVWAYWEFTTASGVNYYQNLTAWRGCFPTFNSWEDYHDDDGGANTC